MKRILPGILFALFMALNSAHAEYPKIPQFQLPTANGHIQPSDLKGKVIYVDFWASWCQPCKQSFPWLNQMQAKYQDKGFEIVGINLDKDKELADKFLAAIPASFTVAFDAEGGSAEKFNVKGMPSSYLIDRNGNMRARHLGFREKDRNNLESAIQSLLKE